MRFQKQKLHEIEDTYFLFCEMVKISLQIMLNIEARMMHVFIL